MDVGADADGVHLVDADDVAALRLDLVRLRVLELVVDPALFLDVDDLRNQAGAGWIPALTVPRWWCRQGDVKAAMGRSKRM